MYIPFECQTGNKVWKRFSYFFFAKNFFLQRMKIIWKYENHLQNMKKVLQSMKKIFKVWKRFEGMKKIWRYEKVLFGYEKTLTFENFRFHTLGYENVGCFFLMWLRPTSVRRLLVLWQGPIARLQGVAIVAGGGGRRGQIRCHNML